MLINLGKKIKQERKLQHMTLKDLSIKSGVSISYISDIEHFRKNPSIYTYLKLANALNLKDTNIEFLDDISDLNDSEQLDYVAYNRNLAKKVVKSFDKIDDFFSDVMSVIQEKNINNDIDIENFKQTLKLNYILENDENINMADSDNDENVVAFVKHIDIMFELFKEYCCLNNIDWKKVNEK